MSCHIQQTAGGVYGHWLRRLIHLSMAVIPFLYYSYAMALASWMHWTPTGLVIAVVALILGFDLLRISQGWCLLGQRHYEVRRLSALAWSALAVGSVLLLAPHSSIAYALIVSAAVVDPLVGELRRFPRAAVWTAGLAIVLVALIWYFAGTLLVLSGGWLLLLAPLTVVAERLPLRWIDDNALMLWLPLLAVCLIIS